MKWWEKYRLRLEKNNWEKPTEVRDISYWRNRLYNNVILYILPLGLIAWIPGVIMSVVGGIPMLAVLDSLIVLFIAFIAFSPVPALRVRKVLLVVCIYLLCIGLMAFLGYFGPGRMYLVALSVFVTLIFPAPAGYWTVAINTFICLLFGIMIHFGIYPPAVVLDYTIGSWIAVSSNVIFLCTACVAALDLLIKGLQTTIDKEELLQKQLREESKVLEKMLVSVDAKNKELEQFAHIASHDLQEPLRTVSSLSSLLEKEYGEKLQGDGKTYLRYLAISTERMRALITGLLDYSRIGKEGKPEQADCNKIVKQVLMGIAVRINETGTHIIVDPLPMIYCFPVELAQLFQNLITNAIKFVKPDIIPEIRISAREEGKQWVFSVSDNGIGIEPRFYEKIFVIFQRLHPRSEYEGTGLGLAYCKKIVELHEGKIWVESEPGKGSAFYFSIPKPEKDEKA